MVGRAQAAAGSLLGSNQLTRTIPASLGGLPVLEQLSLSSNQLTGPIPATLQSLNSLTDLHLESNQLGGTIPGWFGSMPNLRTLSLFSNAFEGPIPDELGNAPRLDYLYLASNALVGVIPQSLGNRTSMKALYLSGNKLEGRIPASLGNLANLYFLHLESNRLTGPIPPSLASLTSLLPGELGLSHNGLFASDPAVRAWSRRTSARLEFDADCSAGELRRVIAHIIESDFHMDSDHLYSEPGTLRSLARTPAAGRRLPQPRTRTSLDSPSMASRPVKPIRARSARSRTPMSTIRSTASRASFRFPSTRRLSRPSPRRSPLSISSR